MRTNVVIDERLISEAMAVSGAKTKKAVVEMGLQALIRQRALAELKGMYGKVNWIGDLEQMRLD